MNATQKGIVWLLVVLMTLLAIGFAIVEYGMAL